ncbi:hypothetical protein [Marinimicrobium locisalis]|uniref:hypothetical protein n=1 Tax=Marinimicrobium locisalis TaxID=546022 RepID=UPI003221A53B
MLSTRVTHALAIVAGLGIGFVAPTILGYTSAIPLSGTYMNWFGEWWKLGLILWEWLVVRVPIYGILGALATWAVVRTGQVHWGIVCVLVILAELAVLLWIYPRLIGLEGATPILHEWLALHLAALIPGVLLGGWLAGRRA